MARYDKLFASLAERAVSHGVIDVQTLVDRMIAAGATEAAIGSALADDLFSDGPVFGKFSRSLQGAAGSSLTAAMRQGEMVGMTQGRKQLDKLRRYANTQGSVLRELDRATIEAAGEADPEAAERVEESLLMEQMFMWICALVNTCHRCLPLHGQSRTMREWREDALLPEIIHDGWDSSCYCKLVAESFASNRKELDAPLRRVKLEKGGRKTQRAISRGDFDKALEEETKH